jgi:hypothetical protein
MSKKPVIAISMAPETYLEPVFDGSDMELPTGAVLDPHGSVTLTLDYPISLRGPSGEEQIEHLTMCRLTGVDMRKVLDAKDSTKVMLGRAVGFTPARLALLYARADASDMAAATKVVAEMVGFGEGLPDNAEKNEDGTIALPLHMPVAPDGGDLVETLLFRRLTGADLDALKRTTGVQTLLTLLARSLRRTPKEMGELFDIMDGRDIVAAQRVTGFLSGNGRLTGR